MEDINKDIEILESLLEEGFEAMCYPEAQAIEHLIKAYKELEENINKQKQLTKIAQTITDESIKEALIEFEKDYIPVSLIKENIEELNKEEQELQNSISDEEREEYSDANISFKLMDIEIRRSVLQELLEKRK